MFDGDNGTRVQVMVKGIDAQYMVTQTYVTEKIQQVQQRQGDGEQRYFDVQLAEERRRLSEKVKRAEEAERLRLEEEAKEKERKKERGEREEKREEDDEGHTVDVKA